MSLGNPGAADLISAVNDFLKKDVASQVDAHTAFHLKVACNVLCIVAREISQGERFSKITNEQIKNLIRSPEDQPSLDSLYQQLCHQIKEDSIDTDDAVILSTLKQITLQQGIHWWRCELLQYNSAGNNFCHIVWLTTSLRLNGTRCPQVPYPKYAACHSPL